MPRRKKEIQGVKTRDVNAAVRVILALDLYTEGHDWKTVAARAGYASAGAAYNAVQRELDRVITVKAEALRKVHQRRLQMLRTVYFPKAMAGDGWSADRCMRFDEREAALFGLDARPDQSQAQAQMVVIGVPQAVLEAV